ncbi:MAG: Na/Pi cotransporter family protein [Bacteroidales bacterium]|nr:Na/Pi cotransporter family protein [Bacteroidales bacterium]
MNYSFFDLLKLLGSLGFFLYGMKLMSESLQKVAGEKMRNILSAMTSNRFMGIFTGLLVTSVIQSSSATTVMLVSFVNAGLLSLTESIGVIMGANIGTTITAWIVLIFGFKVNASVFALPLIALALPLLFSRIKKRSSVGELIIGFAILFMGIDFLKDNAPNINNSPHMTEYIAGFSNLGYWSVLIYLAIGLVLTTIVQSSSAVMALTLVMCNNGWLSFEHAAAMVLGQNIGTTITANLAAIVANVSAKRAAIAHTIFNVSGVLIILVFYYPFLRLIAQLTGWFGYDSPLADGTTGESYSKVSLLMALSIYHSVFNILNTGVLIWFVPQIEKLVKYIVPVKEEDEEFGLKYINTGLMSTGEIAILQAKNEITVYLERVIRMFGYAKDFYEAKTVGKAGKLYSKVKKYEDIADRMELEIASYLTRISEESVSKEGSEKIATMLGVVCNIETLADTVFSFANTIQRKIDSKTQFTKEIEKNISKLISSVEELLANLKKSVQRKDGEGIDTDFKAIDKKLSETEKMLKQEHFRNLHKGKYKASVGVIYSDLYTDTISIGKQAVNVAELFFSDGKVT